jgi:hypothetical protein
MSERKRIRDKPMRGRFWRVSELRHFRPRQRKAMIAETHDENLRRFEAAAEYVEWAKDERPFGEMFHRQQIILCCIGFIYLLKRERLRT